MSADRWSSAAFLFGGNLVARQLVLACAVDFGRATLICRARSFGFKSSYGGCEQDEAVGDDLLAVQVVRSCRPGVFG